MEELTQDLVKDLFNYKDGELYWKNNRCNNKIKAESKAGSLSNNEYNRIKINGKLYLTHRLIYLYHYGYLPEFIDHIDTNKLNNKIENLRSATQSQNQRNRKPNKNSTSIYKGVFWYKITQKWVARIFINNKQKHLGYFTNEKAAAVAYNKKAIELFGEFANLNII